MSIFLIDVDNSGLLYGCGQQWTLLPCMSISSSTPYNRRLVTATKTQRKTQLSVIRTHELAPMTLYDISDGKVNMSMNRVLTAKCKQARIVNIIAVVLAMLALHLCLQ